ncbi:MAG TPA: 6-carboxytetrahydropterin synthase [Gemmatimonadales bacterium]|jgi:6-pyruvoyltetrahydropterin/6-carboxytetrahydropterin synthase|nr:6-carboxytetrahydropterin synthase [Gemmatimonadales bacterium]
MISLTRTVRFPATHRMFRSDWSEAENRAAYGPLAQYHGHEYECGVTVTGVLDPATGMLVDLSLLDAVLKEEVVGRFGGQPLNTLPEFASGRPLPTCEALASVLYTRIAARLPSGVRLVRVMVAEDPTLYAECTGAP